MGILAVFEDCILRCNLIKLMTLPDILALKDFA